MAKVAAVVSRAPMDNRYDASLSYEERAQLRREKRKQRESNPQLVSQMSHNFSVALVSVYSSPCSDLFKAV